ncbi:MAG: 2-C-methyl-D-erythritol 2,4-cyclodiphosphate synthase [Paludibacteraceae bacterium]|nr:2-C-methyl-D-erythritol 2,4-cyclodiphosphate synthase [Paludibacteraceae bacterium]MBO7337550.1 2-C-methyl-D-erythritol 2,4-cyclodiphosphate synthase [Paludibacteraceae bacterium]MBP5135909.1 2-C-methyl-D-erythritol 2,4-cyclodiphosphate synthase [Paludibacteraceae bacterium]
MGKIRVGLGYDVHQFAKDRALWLGGVKISDDNGLLGHSDADVLIHAICDALLGAAHLRDIGYHFPDTSSDFKGIDSKILLRKTVELVRNAGFEIGNVDATVCAQKPKLSPYIEQMQEKLAEVIGTDVENVSVKATTTERLGFVGREEGIAAEAVALIEKI